MSVLSQFELVMTIISGMFLLVHAVSAMLISKKNPYGGKSSGSLNFDKLFQELFYIISLKIFERNV